MTGYAEGVRIIPTLLVASAVMVEIPVPMVVLFRTLNPTVNRRANLVAIILTTTFIIVGGSTSPHYLVLTATELVLLATSCGAHGDGVHKRHPP